MSMIVKLHTKKTLTLCVLAISAATLLTFSQDEVTTPKTVEVAMALPADNVELTDTNGRKITVTVLRHNIKGVTIRMADGKEHQIAWDTLSLETVEKILGKGAERPVDAAIAHQEAVRKAQAEQAAERAAGRIAAEQARQNAHNNSMRIQELAVAANKKIRWGDPKELHRLFIEKDESVQVIADCFDLFTEKKMKHRDAVPISRNILTYYDVGKDLEVTAGEEKVSLREEFEKLGVRLRHQERNLCAIYATYHIAQFAHLSANLPAPSVDQIKALLTPKELADTQTHGSSPRTLLHRMARTQPNGKTMKVLWMSAPTEKLTEELVKHQLRNGKPCVMTITEVIGGGSGRHYIVVVGFHTKNGKTEWEYLNSNNVGDENGGYVKKTGVIFVNRGLGNDGLSVWFE